MPLDNTLNVSELLRRLGVKGDSLGSASLLEALRMNIIIADHSGLVPPLGVPIAAASLQTTSGVATFNKWSLQPRSAGGLQVTTIRTTTNRVFRIFVTDANVFGAIVTAALHNFSFGQEAQSVFAAHTPAAAVAPANSFEIQQNQQPSIGIEFPNWIGPGQFFNIEAEGANASEEISISWKEYPAGLNPG